MINQMGGGNWSKGDDPEAIKLFRKLLDDEIANRTFDFGMPGHARPEFDPRLVSNHVRRFLFRVPQTVQLLLLHYHTSFFLCPNDPDLLWFQRAIKRMPPSEGGSIPDQSISETGQEIDGSWYWTQLISYEGTKLGYGVISALVSRIPRKYSREAIFPDISLYDHDHASYITWIHARWFVNACRIRSRFVLSRIGQSAFRNSSSTSCTHTHIYI